MIATANRMIRGIALACLALLAACSATYENHGYVPSEEELSGLVVGVDTRATVDDVVGPPSAAGLMDQGDYYYVRSRFREYGMFRPEEVSREVVAISFDDSGTIANIERFGLEQGRIVPLSRRVTDSSVVETGFLQQLMGNIGNINPGNFFN
jgi:outer membrane protein assembly factor BamE (lipoprotein component of BamABCDE complex)